MKRRTTLSRTRETYLVRLAVARYRRLLMYLFDASQRMYKRRLTNEIAMLLDDMTERETKAYYRHARELRGRYLGK